MPQLPHLTASQEEEMRTDVLHLIHTSCFSKVRCGQGKLDCTTPARCMTLSSIRS